MIVVLDFLFAYGFAGLGLGAVLAFASLGVDFNSRLLLVTTKSLFISSLLAAAVACIWMCLDVSKRRDADTRLSVWKRIVWRYPALVGPAAYYLAEYRERFTGRPTWFRSAMTNRPLLDALNAICWYGQLAGYALLGIGVIAALLRIAVLFQVAVVLFVILEPEVGLAFCLLSIVVFAHAVDLRVNRRETAKQPWALVPFVGISWARGVRKYYLEAIRPTLVATPDPMR